MASHVKSTAAATSVMTPTITGTARWTRSRRMYMEPAYRRLDGGRSPGGLISACHQQWVVPRPIAQGMAVTQAELGAMKQVDGPEIALLCPGGQAAPQHARPGEEPAPGGETFAPQLVRGRMARLESHRIVGIARIEPPAFLQQPPLLGQAPVKSRARKWHQVSEGRQQESMVDGELHGALEVVRRIGVTSEHERPVHRDMKTPQLGDGAFNAAVHRIDRFAHLAEGGRLKALATAAEAAAGAADD